MHNFLDKGLRGGISIVNQPYSRANFPEMGNLYDKGKPQKHILYVDCTNLYGKCMMLPLPISGFKWLKDTSLEDVNEITFADKVKDYSVMQWTEKILKLEDNSKEGFIFQVDIHYPPALHDEHHNLPFLVETMKLMKFLRSIISINWRDDG